jgi:hypothetical protein
MLRYSHPWLAALLDHWPAAVVLPGTLVVIAVLALVTRRWDQRDEADRAATRRAEAAAGSR